MKQERKKLASISVAGFAFAALSLVQTATAVNIVADAKAETVISPSNTVIKMTQSGTLTVTEPGEIEILLVGGGGGGGMSFSNIEHCHGGGGGGGGVVHIRNLSVAVGEYPIIVGAGGTLNDGNYGVGTGGSTMGFDYTAIGGGPGAAAYGIGVSISDRGASGGGGTRSYEGVVIDGGTAKVADSNIGHNGANSLYPYTSGGGGGAGTAGNGVIGGDGYLCDITGEDIYYAGGGGGGRGYNSPGANGLGGGCENYGGGGRAAGDYTKTSPETGGPGVLIVRFTRNSSKETVFEDATGGTVTTCRVGDKKYRVHTFAQPGQFTIPHHGHVEVLLVGGGGGGGGGAWPCYGGGGGAGGLIHKSELFLTNGVYNIVIGAGGAVGVSGGKTTAFGMTAWGGGHGATGGGANAASGASGGGGAGHYKWTADVTENTKGAEANPAYTNAPYCNLGYAGCKSPYAEECSGGGGGAGGPAGTGTSDNNGTQRANPGAAYICSITGTDVAYAGGGGGRTWNNFHMIDGGGKDSYGGGGNSGGAGGSGVVIIRYQMPKHGLFVLVK